jgi:hypothetical protein
VNRQYFNIGLDYSNADAVARLYEAAKWCHENGFRPKTVKIGEWVFKSFHLHPQLRGRLPIDKHFPPAIEVFGFLFQVDLSPSLEKQIVYNIPLLSGAVTIEDALVFNFFTKE